ncbi:Gut-specific cysteine proteinase [Trichinella britovi]|uniref:UDP-N-acetylglucosamine transferase subunit ALG14 n=1 Tax=Trichinella britovi TaxID=45882 RepID=A0A0V1CPD6_TRIBR|nr:Gut-specific cysteine proteinase [Trichinella britovi]
MSFFICAFICFCVCFSLLLIVRYRRHLRHRRTNSTVSTCVVLGSGGHTMEILRLVQSFDNSKYNPIHFIIADTDSNSVEKVKPMLKDGNVSFSTIRRCREVKQSISNVFLPTLVATGQSLVQIWRTNPELLLCNGPGTCLPVCFAAFFVDLLFGRTCRIIYVESVCRVTRLSLTCKILYYFYIADYVLVQWPELAAVYPRTLYIGSLFAFASAENYEENYERLKVELERQRQANGNTFSWKFGRNAYFKNKSIGEIKKLLGYRILPQPAKERNEMPMPEDLLNLENFNYPVEFDSRKHWPQCEKVISFIKDQANCGSCWAVSSASVMSDRTCIATDGQFTTLLSDAELLSCCTACGYGCNGGYPQRTFKYWVYSGMPTGGPYGSNDTCKPYPIPPCSNCSETRTPKCSKSCISTYPLSLNEDRHYGSTYYQFWLGEKSMMKDISLYGPIVAGMSVYEDFLHYKEGVYTQESGIYLGGHAVRIIGWGKQDNIPYWLVANSWNTTFGEDGLFKIRRGFDECGIESYVSAGRAKCKPNISNNFNSFKYKISIEN